MTADIVYVPINYLRNHIRPLMFDELVIMISSELKSGFQFNHGIKNK